MIATDTPNKNEIEAQTKLREEKKKIKDERKIKKALFPKPTAKRSKVSYAADNSQSSLPGGLMIESLNGQILMIFLFSIWIRLKVGWTHQSFCTKMIDLQASSFKHKLLLMLSNFLVLLRISLRINSFAKFSDM
jgi:hypothetical protein